VPGCACRVRHVGGIARIPRLGVVEGAVNLSAPGRLSILRVNSGNQSRGQIPRSEPLPPATAFAIALGAAVSCRRHSSPHGQPAWPAASSVADSSPAAARPFSRRAVVTVPDKERASCRREV
jgi:hypothetical protein